MATAIYIDLIYIYDIVLRKGMDTTFEPRPYVVKREEITNMPLHIWKQIIEVIYEHELFGYYMYRINKTNMVNAHRKDTSIHLFG